MVVIANNCIIILDFKYTSIVIDLLILILYNTCQNGRTYEVFFSYDYCHIECNVSQCE